MSTIGKFFDVVTLGEILIDFTECGCSSEGTRLFEQNPGGAPANVAGAGSRLGGKSAFIGKAGKDMHGIFLKQVLEREGVDTTGLSLDPKVFTTLAFVSLDENGERSFSFARKPGADTCLTIDEVPNDLLEKCTIFHIGSLSLTDEPARSTTLAAVDKARKAGAIIAYDPNYRASLWASAECAREQMLKVIPLADLVKVSEDEAEMITGYKDPRMAAETLLKEGPYCIAITMGANGAMLVTKAGIEQIPAVPTIPVDTTGAGDAFWGGFLLCIAQRKQVLTELTLEDMSLFARFGNSVASACVSRRGGIPALPTRNEILGNGQLAEYLGSNMKS